MSSNSPIMNTYGDRNNLLLEKGKGVYLWDASGRRYLDALSGIAVCGLGHCHPAVTEAIQKQSETLLHVSNLFNSQPQQNLARLLCDESGMENIFFSNSGAEANEAAIKIARKYGAQKGIQEPTIITMQGSFHGRTLATLTATGSPKVTQGFAPLPQGFLQVPYDDVAAVHALSDNPNIVAILVEPIQGEGGIRVPQRDYLRNLRELCDQNQWLLMLDEIQTGNGRTGNLFAFQGLNVTPDVVTTAKGLGNGLPIGACLARGDAAEIFQPGSHGSTFGGNLLACTVGHTVISTLLKDKLIANAAEQGAYLIEALKKNLQDHPAVADIRGEGLMIGIELTTDCPQLVSKALAAGLILNVTAGNVIRLLPPLIIERQHTDEIVATVTNLVEEFHSSGARKG